MKSERSVTHRKVIVETLCLRVLRAALFLLHIETKRVFLFRYGSSLDLKRVVNKKKAAKKGLFALMAIELFSFWV